MPDVEGVSVGSGNKGFASVQIENEIDTAVRNDAQLDVGVSTVKVQ